MCLFCKIINRDIPAKIVYEDSYVLSFLDISQSTRGHTLVVPKIHTENLLDCPIDYLQLVTEASVTIGRHLMTTLNAKGMNVLTNINEAAGQTIPHYHVHLIPRYGDDDGLTLSFRANKDVDLDVLIKQIQMKEKGL